jgi:hypothetical protein
VNTPKKPPQGRCVDKPASNNWQENAINAKAVAAQKARAAGKGRRADPWEVTPDDLGCLDAVRDLLTALNNAYVSTSQIQKLILEIPVLAARCIKRVGGKQPATPETLAKALTSIGNMGLEGELLGLLEDLTTCRADQLEAEQNAGSSSEPSS